MPLFKKRAAKREEKMDQKKDRKSDLATAFMAQKASKKMAFGGKAQADKAPFPSADNSQAPQTPVSPKRDAEDHRFAMDALQHEHSEQCYAEGGMVCKYGTVADMIRRTRMAEGGLVEDPHDQIEHSNYFDDLNQDIADEPLYEDTASKEPRDSNETGDDREKKRADTQGKSMFNKIKMKKAQPGDRGKY